MKSKSKWVVEKILLLLEFYELAHPLLLPCTTKGSELKDLVVGNRFLRDIYVTCHVFL